MKPKRVFLSLSLATALLVSPGALTVIQAQESEEEDEFVLEDIVVTAEKREGKLQKTPLAISAVTGEMLIRSDINELYNLDKLIPDLRIDGEAGGSFTIASVRNVQTLDFTPIYETVTATHIDNVFLPRYVGLEGHFYDLERVEVLKGPQGTLYGRAATAGSINLITRKPMIGIFGGYGEVEYGRYDKMRVEGAINLPITENIAVRAAFRSIRHDAYNENGYGMDDDRGMRGSLLWEPNDRISLLMTADIVHIDRNDADTGIYFNSYGSLTATTPIDSPWDSSAFYNDADDAFHRADVWGFMAQYDQDLDFATVSLQYGHRAVRSHRLELVAGTFTAFDPVTTSASLVPGMRFSLDSFVPANSDSIEVRLLSNTTAAGGDTWEWVVGANYLDDKGTELVQSFFVNFDARASNNTTALFGQATWSPFDRWHFTGGYRYSWDDKTMRSSTIEDYPDGVFPDTPVHSATAEYGEPSYRANISYDVSDDIMTYIQYARGQKVGNMETNREALPSEILDAYEWGFKSRFLNNRLQANLDAFYYEYKNYNQWFNGGWCISDANGDHFCDDANGDGQVDNDDMDPYVTGSVSPGGSESKGITLGLQWLMTVKSRLSANFAWQTSKYGNYDMKAAVLARWPGNDTVQQAGGSFDNLTDREFGGPNWRGNLGYTHTFYIGDTDTLNINGNLYYEGQGIDQIMFINTGKEYAMPGREAYWLGDISARYSSSYGMPAGMEWHVRVWCNNIWNSTDLASRTFSSTHPQFGDVYPDHSGTVTGTYVLPRTMGIAFGANW
jgi:iron complex outermembrane receptor protein